MCSPVGKRPDYYTCPTLSKGQRTPPLAHEGLHQQRLWAALGFPSTPWVLRQRQAPSPTRWCVTTSPALHSNRQWRTSLLSMAAVVTHLSPPKVWMPRGSSKIIFKSRDKTTVKPNFIFGENVLQEYGWNKDILSWKKTKKTFSANRHALNKLLKKVPQTKEKWWPKKMWTVRKEEEQRGNI